MIVGIGVDVVEVLRVHRLLTRHPERARRRLFTVTELEYCEGRADPLECLAARIAAKEAAFKALGSGKGPGMAWTDIELRRDASGAPSLRLSGAALGLAEKLGADRSFVSVTHDAGVACAVVVLESQGDGAPPP